MPDNNNNKWDGVDRREHLEDVDPISLERRLGHIETNVAVVTSELRSIAESLKMVSTELKELSRPKKNWTEWAGILVISLTALGSFIGVYVNPLYDAVDESNITNIRQWERLNEVKTTVDQRTGLVDDYLRGSDERGKRLDSLEDRIDTIEEVVNKSHK